MSGLNIKTKHNNKNLKNIKFFHKFEIKSIGSNAGDIIKHINIILFISVITFLINSYSIFFIFFYDFN